MTHWFKRGAALLLSAACMMLGACGGQPAETSPASSGGASGEAMGRYIEEEYPFPEQAKIVCGFQRMNDGTMKMLASPSEGRIIGPWTVYESKDGGASWLPVEAPWLSAFEQSMVDAVIFREDGGAYFVTTTYTEEFEAKINEALETGEMPDFSDYPRPVLHEAAPDGTVSEPPVEFQAEEDGRVYLYGLALSGSGDLVACYDSGFSVIDPATGSVKSTLPAADGSWLVSGGTLYVSDERGVTPYDLLTAEQQETIPFEGGEGGRLIMSADGKSLFRCDKSGIYRFVLGGGVWERVVDGELTSLNMPSVWVSSLVEKDGNEFYVLASSGDEYLPLSFRFSPDTPAVPSVELSVYGLGDNDTIRQAMGHFQRQNPDIRVTFRVAVDAESAVTASDAIRALNTELLAGKGPDVLLLDSLPVESYIEKGVLADLSALLPMVEGGELVKNVASTYLRDGALYAVPLRFGAPQMWGDASFLGAAQDLSSLADWAERDFAQNGRRLLYRMKPEELLEDFYLTCSPAWRGEDGSIRQEELARFLTDVKRLSDLAADPALEGDMVTPELFEQWGSIEYQGIYWLNGWIRAVMGESLDMADLASPEAAAAALGDGGYAPMTGQAQGVYVPRVVLGVNQNSALREKAAEFVQTALSERVQAQSFGDGYAVNRAALLASAKNPYPPGDDGKQAPVYENGEMRIFQYIWPAESFMNEYVARLETLSTPCTKDPVLLEMMLDETRDFFAGGKSAQETAGAIAQRTQAYLAE